MTQFRMFSDPALRRFKQFCDEASRPTQDPRAHQGAHDIKQVFGVVQPLTPWPKRRGMGSDVQAREIVEANSARDDDMTDEDIATDAQEPDRDSVAAVLACITESLGDSAAAEVMRVLHLKWEGVAGEQPGLDGETRADRVTGGEDDEYGSYWPGQRRNQEADKSIVGGAKDNPLPTPGTPRPGGKHWPFATDAAVRSYEQRFPNAARLAGTSTYVRPRGRANLAMDAASSAAADSYTKRWPDAVRLGLDPIQHKRG